MATVVIVGCSSDKSPVRPGALRPAGHRRHRDRRHRREGRGIPDAPRGSAQRRHRRANSLPGGGGELGRRRSPTVQQSGPLPDRLLQQQREGRPGLHGGSFRNDSTAVRERSIRPTPTNSSRSAPKVMFSAIGSNVIRLRRFDVAGAATPARRHRLRRRAVRRRPRPDDPAVELFDQDGASLGRYLAPVRSGRQRPLVRGR